MTPEEIAYMLVDDAGELISLPSGMQVFSRLEAIDAESEAQVVSTFRGVPVHVRRGRGEVVND